MLYTALTKKALRIAYNAHRGQEDEAGLPYIHHPLHLAEQMPDEASITVALLHDVVEKTMMTFADLERAGFPAAILEALRLLTREPAVPYQKYIAALKGPPHRPSGQNRRPAARQRSRPVPGADRPDCESSEHQHPCAAAARRRQRIIPQHVMTTPKGRGMDNGPKRA